MTSSYWQLVTTELLKMWWLGAFSRVCVCGEQMQRGHGHHVTGIGSASLYGPRLRGA